MAAYEDQERLPELLESAQQLLEEVEEWPGPSGSQLVQEKVSAGLNLLQKASEMLAQLDLFSRNEDLEEIASADLKYLLLPALRGALTMKQVGSGSGQRLDQLQEAREHFVRFLTQCSHYGVAEFPLPGAAGSSADVSSRPAASMADPGLLVAMASQRQAKIQRYKQKKELERRMAELKAAVEGGQAEDELVREYHFLHLRRWITISLEEVESIDQEMMILREKDAPRDTPSSHSPPLDRPPLKPFVLARNTTHAKVFGAGYPSVATMTVNDWYEQHQKCDLLPPPGSVPHSPVEFHKESQTPEDQELKEPEEEEKEVHRAQEWDDWKDTHPRGYGNRQNMG